MCRHIMIIYWFLIINLYSYLKSISKIEYFRIFNRYGNLVFETSDISKGWDGNYKNKKQDTGSYIFIVKGISITGTPVVRKGTLLLIN